MPGLALNEDDSHFYFSRTADQMTVEGLKEMVDHYASPQMREILFNPNAMRVSCASTVWDPIWKGYDPDAGLDQPLFAEHRKSDPDIDVSGVQRWVYNAWLLDQRKINPYEVWLAYTREKGISAWISMRMNDVHDVHNPGSVLHADLWRNRPDLRRVPYRFETWPDRAFDYGQKEVREYHLALIKEYFERFDLDGLELDWMRFGYHFRPGHEERGRKLLTEFLAEVRRLAKDAAERLGHPVNVGARVPARPQTARGLGMDAIEWARLGLVDMVVPTPFWTTSDFDIPIEQWKELLCGLPVTLAAGLELGIAPYPQAWQAGRMSNTAETVRGAAASFFHRGADRLYLFNYMDSDTTVDETTDYHQILHQAGSIETAIAHPRRHVVTFTDTWPPGDPMPLALPTECRKGKTAAFRIHIGPKPKDRSARVFIGLGEAGNRDGRALEVRVNGELCSASDAPSGSVPKIVKETAGFDIDVSALNDAYNVVEVTGKSDQPHQIVWAEIRIGR